MKHRISPQKRILLAALMIGALAAAVGLVMILWNWVAAGVLGLPVLGYWEAGGLLALCRLLFGGFHFGPRGGGHPAKPPHLREKWKSMSDEERERFKAEWKQRCKS